MSRGYANGFKIDVTSSAPACFQEYGKSISKRIAKNMRGCVSLHSYYCTLATRSLRSESETILA